jgi:DNA-binding transcriptional LysR family regulator
VALSSPDCLFRQWAGQALDAAALPWRLAYVSTSLAAVEAIVLQGLAVTVVKGSMLSPGLRALPAGRLPALPGAEIRLHLAAGCTDLTEMVADHLVQGLRRR